MTMFEFKKCQLAVAAEDKVVVIESMHMGVSFYDAQQLHRRHLASITRPGAHTGHLSRKTRIPSILDKCSVILGTAAFADSCRRSRLIGHA
jgi:alpha-D-ribose 1-methylphosphonate 5-triphosphate synthase subunit PhnH